MEEGVTFAWDMGFYYVVFECDSKVVSDLVNGYCELPTTIGNIIDGIRHKLKDFWQVLVSRIGRQGNRFAHLSMLGVLLVLFKRKFLFLLNQL